MKSFESALRFASAVLEEAGDVDAFTIDVDSDILPQITRAFESLQCHVELNPSGEGTVVVRRTWGMLSPDQVQSTQEDYSRAE